MKKNKIKNLLMSKGITEDEYLSWKKCNHIIGIARRKTVMTEEQKEKIKTLNTIKNIKMVRDIAQENIINLKNKKII